MIDAHQLDICGAHELTTKEKQKKLETNEVNSIFILRSVNMQKGRRMSELRVWLQTNDVGRSVGRSNYVGKMFRLVWACDTNRW